MFIIDQATIVNTVSYSDIQGSSHRVIGIETSTSNVVAATITCIGNRSTSSDRNDQRCPPPNQSVKAASLLVICVTLEQVSYNIKVLARNLNQTLNLTK